MVGRIFQSKSGQEIVYFLCAPFLMLGNTDPKGAVLLRR